MALYHVILLYRYQDTGYYKGPTRPYGPEARPHPHGEGSYPVYENNGPRCDYRHPPPPPPPTSYPGSNLPMPLEDRYVSCYVQQNEILLVIGSTEILECIEGITLTHVSFQSHFTYL